MKKLLNKTCKTWNKIKKIWNNLKNGQDIMRYLSNK